MQLCAKLKQGGRPFFFKKPGIVHSRLPVGLHLFFLASVSDLGLGFGFYDHHAGYVLAK